MLTKGLYCRSLKSLVDAGDIIGARGGVKRTDKGELSVNAAHVEILTKSLMPLPDKWHGLADIEKRYRQRCFPQQSQPNSHCQPLRVFTIAPQAKALAN